jgi:hypothetical protein
VGRNGFGGVHLSALAEMSQCKLTTYLNKGFGLLEQYEASGAKDRPSLARSAAWQFLLHEQTLHLQKMVYDHKEFRDAIDMNDFGRLPVLPFTNDRRSVTSGRLQIIDGRPS